VLAGRVRWGTRELRKTLLAAARAVAVAHPRSVLVVGNLSAREGGRIKVSVSHQSGRDADLLFYARSTRRDRPVTPGRFVRYGEDGVSSNGRLRFDVPRNWALVQALLADERPVQWLFVAAPLRDALLDHARSIGAPPELVAKATLALHEPHGSTSHNDHFHLRLHCAPDDVLDGCRDYGPRRAWAPLPHTQLQRRVAALRALLGDTKAPGGRRRAALRQIVALGAKEAWPTLVALADGADGKLALAGLRALRKLRVAAAAGPLAEGLRVGSDLGRLEARLRALRVLDAPQVWPALLGLRHDARRLPGRGRSSVAQVALEVLELQAPPVALPAVVEALREEESAGLRAALVRIAERITLAGPLPPADEPTAGRAWTLWASAHGDGGRTQWWEAGFAAAGHPLPAGLCGLPSVPALIDALGDERRPVRQAARDLLRAITEMRPWRPGTKRLGQRFWRRWWEHSGSQALAEAPAEQAGRRDPVPEPSVPEPSVPEPAPPEPAAPEPAAPEPAVPEPAAPEPPAPGPRSHGDSSAGTTTSP